MLHYLKNFLLFCHDNIHSCGGVCEFPQNLRLKCGFPDTGKSELYIREQSKAPDGVWWGGITASNCTELNFSGRPINGTTRLLILTNALMPILRTEVRRKCSLLIALSARDFLKRNFPEPWNGHGSLAFPSTPTASTHSLLYRPKNCGDYSKQMQLQKGTHEQASAEAAFSSITQMR